MISLVCPMYNEESMLEVFFNEIFKAMCDEEDYEIICIDDGSTDNTLPLLLSIKSSCSRLRVISFSRNFGKEAALTAGLQHAKGDAIIPIDTDLQDPPEVIGILIQEWRRGFQVVLAKRKERLHDSWIKRTSAKFFYKLHNKLSHQQIPNNVGDFRLMDRKVVDAINLLPERQRFMKGIFSWVGFRTTIVTYSRPARVFGCTKFNFWQLWNFALEGVTSFSTVPLKIWSYFGAIISLSSFFYSLVIIFRTTVYGVDVPGYASLLVAVLFLGGTQLIGIGVLGEYIGRIYMEVKFRPLYIIDREY
ncbi:MAG: glycosyltransferase family 2 protein [Shewanella psychromarinicola]|uniref:glycosyltransferase family 2 protein n=1 Tax=Shewanella psychromarinicola TaxID=2487742 RepID=UPI0030032590